MEARFRIPIKIYDSRSRFIRQDLPPRSSAIFCDLLQSSVTGCNLMRSLIAGVESLIGVEYGVEVGEYGVEVLA